MKTRSARTSTAALLAVLLLLAGACSGDPDRDQGAAPSEKTGREKSTRSSPATVREKSEDTTPEATLGADPEPPGVVLRIEGSRKTEFSGICAVAGEDNVLSGKVPKRFTFDLPEGHRLSCRIEKQDSGKGALKVILTANGTTRSVQQTTSSGGVINVSYSGG